MSQGHSSLRKARRATTDLVGGKGITKAQLGRMWEFDAVTHLQYRDLMRGLGTKRRVTLEDLISVRDSRRAGRRDRKAEDVKGEKWGRVL